MKLTKETELEIYVCAIVIGSKITNYDYQLYRHKISAEERLIVLNSQREDVDDPKYSVVKVDGWATA